MDPFRVLGRLVGGPLGLLARVRGGKPMHPRGAVFDAVLHRLGHGEPWGVAWLDESAGEPAVVRMSRGAGLPAALPDLLGLAVRVVAADAEPVDLLLTSAGRGRLGRLLPVPRKDPATSYGSIMGYRSDAGTIRLAALPEHPQESGGEVAAPPRVFVLSAARGAGSWQPFARLTLTAPAAPLDPDVRFDAVRHPPPGLVADGPMARFRAPAYAAARRGRS
jgi:hypothetical protein